MPELSEADGAAMMARVFRPAVARTTVSAFLVQGGGRTVLIDAGGGGVFGPTLGRLGANLAAAGVQPGDVDTILLTHMHGDHVGGMTKDGAAVFPRAAVMAAEAERAYWLEGDTAAMSEAQRGAAGTARAMLAPYMDRLSTFGGGAAVPGITPVPLPGHTPGHTGFRIGSGGDALLVWGDVIHLQDIQGPRPGIGLMFDSDPQQAIETRQRVLAETAADRSLIAGMHLHFPTFHHVAKAGEGYALVPEMWFPGV